VAIDPQAERENRRRRALGWSLACPLTMPGVDIGRDLAFVTGPGGTDFARVVGIDNLSQSLQLALTTLLGSDVFNTDFGFDGLNALAEETHPVLVRERVRVSVIRVLQRDARIRRVLDVRLDDPTTSARAGGVLRTEVAFEVITGDQASVSLGQSTPVTPAPVVSRG
jgi:phage baseplate assembly protein W